MKYITLVPCYGRDYKYKKEVVEAWEGGGERFPNHGYFIPRGWKGSQQESTGGEANYPEHQVQKSDPDMCHQAQLLES